MPAASAGTRLELSSHCFLQQIMRRCDMDFAFGIVQGSDGLMHVRLTRRRVGSAERRAVVSQVRLFLVPYTILQSHAHSMHHIRLTMVSLHCSHPTARTGHKMPFHQNSLVAGSAERFCMRSASDHGGLHFTHVCAHVCVRHLLRILLITDTCHRLPLSKSSRNCARLHHAQGCLSRLRLS
jgi:hypothetical protein